MTREQLLNQIATDPAYALNLVVLNNPGAVTQALMGDGIIQDGLTESQLLDQLMTIYNAGEVTFLISILQQVEYLRGSELPEGYDALLVGPQAQRLVGGAEGDGTQGTGIDWGSIINGVVTAIGDNIGTWVGGTESTTIGGGGDVIDHTQPPPPAPQTDYTPYLIGGGALIILIALIFAIVKIKR